jgi:hypothetical protein
LLDFKRHEPITNFGAGMRSDPFQLALVRLGLSDIAPNQVRFIEASGRNALPRLRRLPQTGLPPTPAGPRKEWRRETALA